MLPAELLDACRDRPLLLGFLEAVADACDPATGLPVKSRLDVVRMGRQRILPNIYILERCADGQFRYRLAGEEIVFNLGQSPRGKTLGEVLGPEAMARFAPVFDSLLEERTIMYQRGPAHRGSRMFYYGYRVFVPMCEAGAEPTLVLCCYDRDKQERRAVFETGLTFIDEKVLTFPLRPEVDKAP